jgi:hypothetical protein
LFALIVSIAFENFRPGALTFVGAAHGQWPAIS